MPNGEPYLSLESVEAALDGLVYSTRPQPPNPLQWLLLIERVVLDPAMPLTPYAREYALKTLLVDVITDALREKRAGFALPPPDPRLPLAEVKRQLPADVQSPELLAWSVLYHRYVRGDVSQEEMSALVGMETRNLRRYHTYGLRELTHRLIDMERRARAEGRRRRLEALLPALVRVYGRDGWLAMIRERLAAASPRHLLITGAAGVGKSTFVQALLHAQIEADALDQLVWLDQPVSVVAVREMLIERLLPEGGMTLREYSLVYRTAVILDGIERLHRDELIRLLSDLGAAWVYLISVPYTPLDTLHLALPDLDAEAAALLVRDALPLNLAVDERLAREIAMTMLETVGGNPQAIKLMAGLLDYEEWAVVRLKAQRELFETAFAQLNDVDKLMGCALALCPAHSARLEDLNALWGITPESAGRLLRRYLVERREDVYTLAAGAGEYLLAGAEMTAYFQWLVAQLAVERVMGGALEIVEHILLSDYPFLDSAYRTLWIGKLWRLGLARGHWARWRQLLEGCQEVELCIGYGVCLRRLGEWTSAEKVFRQAVMDSGRRGLFREQGEALVQWSILARYRGDYRGAAAMLAQAERNFGRNPPPALRIEMAQMALDERRGEDALKALAGLEENAHVMTLHGEACLLLNDLPRSRAALQRALMVGAEGVEARIYSVFAQGYEREGDLATAEQYLAAAVTLLEGREDAHGLARAQTNLAAVLIRLGRYDEARGLLLAALRVQTLMGDTVGLAATRHNLTILDADITR